MIWAGVGLFPLARAFGIRGVLDFAHGKDGWAAYRTMGSAWPSYGLFFNGLLVGNLHGCPWIQVLSWICEVTSWKGYRLRNSFHIKAKQVVIVSISHIRNGKGRYVGGCAVTIQDDHFV